ncbi:MAG TPA: type VI secretion system tip protein TssI/VgrG, partial [Pyrinomonadaceae bacterium]
DTFTSDRLEVVPQFWLLTRRAQSRIFQHLSVPEILKKVLGPLNVSFQLQGTFHPRDYCVQYRETDFNFASRLMEEEGICYFFKHTAGGHQMVVANTPQSHPDAPFNSRITFEVIEGGTRDDERIYAWEKTQELGAGKYTLWDHSFELPHKHLEATTNIIETVQAGEETHKLKVGGNDQLEIYDYPGEYAQRFDGVNKGGGEQAAEMQKIFEDNRRTVKIRMDQETVSNLIIKGTSNCRPLVSGHKFTLERHFNADGQYVLTNITHAARLSADDYRSGEGSEFTYENTFTCIPAALPFRPPRTTPKPVVQGTQTAVVVGPAGEEIFTDKYGRVKVQFHWDREGKSNLDSSCWIRVAQTGAGKRWGSVYIPRVGHEVVVDFLEGDPDQPIIVGVVYNASEMPPYTLPEHKTRTVLFKSLTYKGSGFNEFRIEDKKGEEQIFIHAERNKDIRIKKNRFETVGGSAHLIVGGDQLESVGNDKHLKVKGDQNEKVDGTVSLTVGADMQDKVAQKYALDAGNEIHLKAGMNVVVESGVSLTLKAGSNFILLDASGIYISGTMVMINSGGAAGSGAGSQPEAPKYPQEADKAEAGEKSQPPPAGTPPPAYSYSPAALVMKQAAKNGTPFCEICAEQSA